MTAQEIVDILNNNGHENYSFCYNLEKLIDNDNIEEAINCIQDKFHCDQETANEGFVLFKKQIYTEVKRIEAESRASLTPQQIVHANAVAREWQNKPKCPTCTSTNIKKISTTSKVMNTATFGILGTKRHKTFHCNNCGYEW